jgi:hypothetical protein
MKNVIGLGTPLGTGLGTDIIGLGKVLWAWGCASGDAKASSRLGPVRRTSLREDFALLS